MSFLRIFWNYFRRHRNRNLQSVNDSTVASLDTQQAKFREVYELADWCGGPTGQKIRDMVEAIIEEDMKNQYERELRITTSNETSPAPSTSTPSVMRRKLRTARSVPAATSIETGRRFASNPHVPNLPVGDSRVDLPSVPTYIHIGSIHSLSFGTLVDHDPTPLDPDAVLWTTKTVLYHWNSIDHVSESFLQSRSLALEEAIAVGNAKFTATLAHELQAKVEAIVRSNENLKRLFYDS
jgi:hypothetical protein